MKALIFFLFFFSIKNTLGQSQFLDRCKQVNVGTETNIQYKFQISWLKTFFGTENCKSLEKKLKDLTSFSEFLPNPISTKAIDRFNSFKPLQLKNSINLSESLSTEWNQVAVYFNKLELFREFQNLKHVFHINSSETNICKTLNDVPSIDSITMLSPDLQENEIKCINDRKIKIYIIGTYTPTETAYFIRNQIYGIEDYNGDIEQIQLYQKLSYLGLINYSGTSNLKVLSELRNLTSLNLNIHHISVPEGLENLQDLSYLSINCYHKYSRCQDKALKDIKFLSKLKFLIGLDLSWNNIEDISPISELPKLKYLSLRMNKIKELIPFEGLKKLVFIDLAGNELNSIDGIEQLVNLKYLNVAGNNISHINKISKLSQLKFLSIGNNPIEDFENFYPTSKLKLLNMDAEAPYSYSDSHVNAVLSILHKSADENNEIFWPELSLIMNKDMYEKPKTKKRITNLNLDSLKRFKNLEILSLSNNNIKFNSSFAFLKKIVYLDISGSDISSLKFLPLNIEYLKARNANLEGLHFLKNLNKIKILDVGENNLLLEGYEFENPTLEVIKLDKCSLKNVPDLTNAKKLNSLDLQHNLIKDFPNLTSNNLVLLDLANNKFRDVPDFSKLTNLQFVFLDGNTITDLTSFKIKSDSNIIYSLERNPIQIELCPLNSLNESINKFCSSL